MPSYSSSDHNHVKWLSERYWLQARLDDLSTSPPNRHQKPDARPLEAPDFSDEEGTNASKEWTFSRESSHITTHMAHDHTLNSWTFSLTLLRFIDVHSNHHISMHLVGRCWNKTAGSLDQGAAEHQAAQPSCCGAPAQVVTWLHCKEATLFGSEMPKFHPIFLYFYMVIKEGRTVKPCKINLNSNSSMMKYWWFNIDSMIINGKWRSCSLTSKFLFGCQRRPLPPSAQATISVEHKTSWPSSCWFGWNKRANCHGCPASAMSNHQAT